MSNNERHHAPEESALVGLVRRFKIKEEAMAAAQAFVTESGRLDPEKLAAFEALQAAHTEVDEVEQAPQSTVDVVDDVPEWVEESIDLVDEATISSSPAPARRPSIKFEVNGQAPENLFVVGPGMFVQMDFVDSGNQLVLPLKQGKTLVFGRYYSGSEEEPDIEMEPFTNEWDSISRRHAAMTLQGRRLDLQDLNSTNGTYLNGVEFDPYEIHQIRSGDLVQFGTVNIFVTFHLIESRIVEGGFGRRHDTTEVPIVGDD